MRILIIGAAGMLGRKLSERLARDGSLGAQPISALVRADVAGGVDTIAADLTDPGAAADLIASRPDVIVDLAAVVSGEAESDFEKGYRVNLDATRHLLEAIRLAGPDYRPRLVFSSSIAVFGPPMPDVIADDHPTTPATSYGTQKAIVELLLADYTRRGFVDAIAIRLPTICVRPGRAEPGRVGLLLQHHPRAAAQPARRPARLGRSPPLVRLAARGRRLSHPCRGRSTPALWACGGTLTMPGLSATVGEEIEALRRVAGDDAVALIRSEPDDTIARIVDGWPRAFDARRASELGFTAERDFDEIVRVYVEDEMS